MNRKRFWLYGRVASPDSHALEIQMEGLRRFAENWKLNVVGQSQDEQSGLTYDRPGIIQFLDSVKARKVDALLVKDYCAIIGLNQKDLENQGILA